MQQDCTNPKSARHLRSINLSTLSISKQQMFIIIYLSWSWAACWPVPVSRIQKSLQRSAMIPSASWGIVLQQMIYSEMWFHTALWVDCIFRVQTATVGSPTRSKFLSKHNASHHKKHSSINLLIQTVTCQGRTENHKYCEIYFMMTNLLKAQHRIRMELQFHPDPAHKMSANLYDIHHCCVYSEKQLMMDRGTAWNMQSFIPRINLRN